MGHVVNHHRDYRLLSVLEKSPPVKALMAIEPLKSTFLNALVRGAGR